MCERSRAGIWVVWWCVALALAGCRDEGSADGGDLPTLAQVSGLIDLPGGNDEGWVAAGQPALATPESGWLVGTVRNTATKAPLNGAVVQVRGVEGELVTGDDGSFRFPVTPVHGSGVFFLDIHHLHYTSAYRKFAVHAQQPTAVGTIYLTPLDAAIGTLRPEGSRHTSASGLVQVEAPAGAVSVGTVVRATAFPFGEALPGPLPSTSFFTHAIELGPEGQQFAQPVTIRVKNTRGFAAGTAIPVGYFNKTTAEWEHEGMGKISADGAWIEYQVTHFSPRDLNYPTIMPPGAINPTAIAPQTTDSVGLGDGRCGGSEVKLASGELMQSFALPSYALLDATYGVTLAYSSATAAPTARVAFQKDPESATPMRCSRHKWVIRCAWPGE
ncbi:MAG: carboxypeptidase regulatory-like domain-containing protein [Deltaproteobacteria bacterium]|nr:carboxypeptidase regulatory-like domain-containing protein [Deltaproteobacteria bacterium]